MCLCVCVFVCWSLARSRTRAHALSLYLCMQTEREVAHSHLFFAVSFVFEKIFEKASGRDAKGIQHTADAEICHAATVTCASQVRGYRYSIVREHILL